MNIVLISWKDIKNPQAGGAEILTHEIAKRAVKKGHKVTILSGLFPHGKKEAILDGVKIIRPTYFHPTQATAYFNWPLFLIKVAQTVKKIETKTDIIVDQVHGLPSFAALYTKKPTVIFPLEVAEEIWSKEIPFPANLIGLALEKAYLKLFQNYHFATISPSTAQDLKKAGIKQVSIITPGINSPPQNLPAKTKHPSFASLGRLTPMKRIEHTLQAFSIFRKNHPQSMLEIIGIGNLSYQKKLKEITKSLKLTKSINFYGYVSDKKKYELLSQSWAILSTSTREGWGLNVIEAASVTTPALAYNVPGIKDAIINNKTGLLTKTNTPQNLANLMRKFSKEKTLRKKLGTQAKHHAQQFTWQKTTDQFLSALNKTLNPER